MAIPKITEQNVHDALRYIDNNGVPFHNQSMKYMLVTEDGKKYPPKYVIAVAANIANGEEISTDKFNTVEANNYLQGLGFTIEIKQVRFPRSIRICILIRTRNFTFPKMSTSLAP